MYARELCVKDAAAGANDGGVARLERLFAAKREDTKAAPANHDEEAVVLGPPAPNSCNRRGGITTDEIYP